MLHGSLEKLTFYILHVILKHCFDCLIFFKKKNHSKLNIFARQSKISSNPT